MTVRRESEHGNCEIRWGELSPARQHMRQPDSSSFQQHLAYDMHQPDTQQLQQQQHSPSLDMQLQHPFSPLLQQHQNAEGDFPRHQHEKHRQEKSSSNRPCHYYEQQRRYQHCAPFHLLQEHGGLSFNESAQKSNQQYHVPQHEQLQPRCKHNDYQQLSNKSSSHQATLQHQLPYALEQTQSQQGYKYAECKHSLPAHWPIIKSNLRADHRSLLHNNDGLPSSQPAQADKLTGPSLNLSPKSGLESLKSALISFQ
ncbi:unnamed protein product [Protopolystoma xenopodis]|uniref:Uncharacterized protein n=1 Tax=Protopolystoma xenopodis TaxID=117903 RepID=A0A448X0C5_9PLAT|nr:unnamed protein product [Protopolystoma xenopodis]